MAAYLLTVYVIYSSLLYANFYGVLVYTYTFVQITFRKSFPEDHF